MTDDSRRRLPPLKRLDAGALARLLARGGAPADAISRGETRTVPLGEAVRAAGLDEAATELAAISPDGVIDWRRFDVTRFGALLPSLAYLDKTEAVGGAPDFVYRFCGEMIQQVARRTLRGARISDILVGDARQSILKEYAACLETGAPRASAGRVVVSDMTWLRYLRFLYPAATDGKTPDRLLLVLLFAEA